MPRVMAPSKKAGISGVGRKTMRMFRSSQLGGVGGGRLGEGGELFSQRKEHEDKLLMASSARGGIPIPKA